ncbi:MAG: helix-turn-helix domain-containing protein [Phycisphaerales bacterium]
MVSVPYNLRATVTDRREMDAALTARVRLVLGSRTLREAAKVGGVSVETVRRYLNGTTPSCEFLGRVCERLGLNAEWMLLGEGPMLLEGLYADALRSATNEQLMNEVARKFDSLNERVARLEVAVFAGARGAEPSAVSTKK